MLFYSYSTVNNTLLFNGCLSDTFGKIHWNIYKKHTFVLGTVLRESKQRGTKFVRPSKIVRTVKTESNTILIDNLNPATTKTDLEALIKPFGPIQTLSLARDKVANVCKGYIQFKFRNDAAKAISILDGHGYEYLILSVNLLEPTCKDTMLAVGKVGDEKKVLEADDGSNMSPRDDSYYTNLSNSITESELEDLFKVFGPIRKRYLAKDKDKVLFW